PLEGQVAKRAPTSFGRVMIRPPRVVPAPLKVRSAARRRRPAAVGCRSGSTAVVVARGLPTGHAVAYRSRLLRADAAPPIHWAAVAAAPSRYRWGVKRLNVPIGWRVHRRPTYAGAANV